MVKRQNSFNTTKSIFEGAKKDNKEENKKNRVSESPFPDRQKDEEEDKVALWMPKGMVNNNNKNNKNNNDGVHNKTGRSASIATAAAAAEG